MITASDNKLGDRIDKNAEKIGKEFGFKDKKKKLRSWRRRK